MGLQMRLNKLSKIIFHGKVNGFPVDLDLDEEILSKGEIPDFISSGALNAVVVELKSNGVEPNLSNTAATIENKASKWSKGGSSQQWECPEHGAQFVRASKWGKSYCAGFKPLDESREDGGRPDWAKDEPNEYQGQLKWFCANKEQ